MTNQAAIPSSNHARNHHDGQLDPSQAQALMLVDIEGILSGEVADVLGYRPEDVGLALHISCDDVRGALDACVEGL